METKPLLYGLIGFFIGGLIVSIAATVSPRSDTTNEREMPMNSMSMDAINEELKTKKGDAFDSAFLSSMIVHHEGALEMAKLSADNAKHEEIKQLSREIITAQESEIAKMKQWQKAWDYSTDESKHMSH